MKSGRGKFGKDERGLEGEGTPFRRVSLLPPSLPHPPNFPAWRPPHGGWNFIGGWSGGCHAGKFLGESGGAEVGESAATAPKKRSRIFSGKVLKVLRKLFQKFSEQGLGQSPKVLAACGCRAKKEK